MRDNSKWEGAWSDGDVGVVGGWVSGRGGGDDVLETRSRVGGEWWHGPVIRRRQYGKESGERVMTTMEYGN